MTLSLSFEDEVLTITDDITGIEWFVRIAHGDGLSTEPQLGFLADGWVYCATGQSIITLANFSTGQIRAVRCEFNGVRMRESYSYSTVCRSTDGKSLFAMGHVGDDHVGKMSLFVIDVTDGRVTNAFFDLGSYPINSRGYGHSIMAQLTDGRVAISAYKSDQSIESFGLTYVDPQNGQITHDFHEGNLLFGGFHSPSPDGCLWVMPDRRQVQIKLEQPSVLDQLQGRQPTLYVGLSLQVWRAAPLTFLTSIVTTWLPVADLPLYNFDWSPLGTKDEVKQAFYRILSKSLAKADLGYLETLSPDQLPDYLNQVDANYCQQILETLREFLRLHKAVIWQENGKAFWTCVNNKWNCVHLDGGSSSRFCIERLERSGEISVGESAKATLKFDYSSDLLGKVELNGDAVPKPWLPKHIVVADDENMEILRKAKKETTERRDAFRIASSVVEVPIRSLEFEGVIEGLRATRDALTEQFLLKLSHNSGGFSYHLPDRTLTEQAFFEYVGDMGAGMAAPLAEVIEAYLTLIGDRYVFHFSLDADEGVGILGYAVTALAMLDTKYLDLVRQYGRTLDRGCEKWFAPVTLPRTIARHGWTDDVIDFALWVMKWCFYNSLHDYSLVWIEYGMGKAVQKRFTQKQFADRIVRVLNAKENYWNSSDDDAEPIVFNYNFSPPVISARHDMIDKLELNLRNNMDDWTKALFELLSPRPNA